MKIHRPSQGFSSGSGVNFPASPENKFLRDDRTWQAVPGGGDMLKSEYDANEDGTVDAAARANLRIASEEIEITEGKVNHVLSNAPTTYRKLTVRGGPECEYGIDYTITGTTLSWEGLGLDGYLVTGEYLAIEYSY